jgi:tetratricopeptide (TPR) repeat protein
MSKPMLVTLPFVMLLLDFWPLQKFPLAAFRLPLLSEKIPFFLLTAISCAVTYFAQRNDAVASLAKVPLQLRFENTLTAYPSYLFKTIWPINLSVFYPLPGQIPWMIVAASAAFLFLVTAMVWLERQRSPWLLVGWLWFVGTLVPVIGLVQVGDQAMADRYSYFPLIGIFIAVTFAFQKCAAQFHIPKIVSVVSGVLILTACLVLTENQLRYWHDSESLFTHALAVTKDNALAHLNLGAAFEENRKSAEALAQYQQALALNPQRDEADNNIGKLFYEMNQPEAALGYCLKAVELNPKRASSHNNLGLVLVALNRFDEAMSQFSDAARLDTTYAAPRFQTGRTLLKLGRDAEAMPFFHEALQIEPDNYQMLIYVARVLASDENPQIRNGNEALALAERANKLAGGAQPVALDTLAMACAEAGRFDEAVQIQQQAVKLAESAGQTDDAVPMRQRLQLYKNHQPWRESFFKK